MKIRKPYDKHARVTCDPVGESRTKQSFRDETDINAIMKKYEKNAIVEHVNRFDGQYGDFLGAVDYHEAMNIVASANSMFETLPATVRARFDNDPSAFLSFVEDENNAEEMYEMGLAHRPPVSPDEIVMPVDYKPEVVESPSPTGEGSRPVEVVDP